MKKKNPLLNIEGEIIRKQYFNTCVIYICVMFVFVSIAMAFASASQGRREFNDFVANIGTILSTVFVLALPFVLLSVLNRRYFGKVVCVLNGDGLHYDGGTLSWDDIERIEYDISLPSKSRYRPCKAVVYTKDCSYEIIHAPFFLLSRARKYSPFLPTALSRLSIIRIIMAVGAMCAAIIISSILRINETDN